MVQSDCEDSERISGYSTIFILCCQAGLTRGCNGVLWGAMRYGDEKSGGVQPITYVRERAPLK